MWGDRCRRARAWMAAGLALALWSLVAAAQEPQPVPPPELPKEEPKPPPEAPAPPPVGDPKAVVEEGLKRITSDAILSHLSFLASDDLRGREAGTPESRRAASYIESQFRKAGCEPLGDQGTFFQPFRIPGRLEPTADCAAAIRTVDREFGWVPDVDCRPCGAAANPDASGGVVFVGYGVTAERLGYDDWAGVDCHGKLALVLRGTPRAGHAEDPFPGSSAMHHAAVATKARLAARHGAVGVLLATGPEASTAAQEALDERVIPTPLPVVQVTGSALDRVLRRAGLSLPELAAPIATTGQPASRELPLVARVRAVCAEVNTLTHNVIGCLRGRDPALATEALVVGGHYDHVGFGHFGSRSASVGEIHNGADDNASGTSGVIALARVMQELGYRPRRSIVFMAFGAEEKGLYGSKHFVEHPTWPNEKIVAMINLDMIGRGANSWCSANGVGTSPGFRTMVERLNEKVGLTLEFSEGGLAPSDNTWFYRRNIPVLFFFTGTHPEYHSPGDDVALIEREGITRVVRLAFLCAYVLAEADTRPEFQRHDLSEIPRLRDADLTRRRTWLGLDCDPRPTPGGIALRAVDPSSPAALQFLAAGDRITRVGPIEAPTPDVLETVLQRLAAGDRLALTVVSGSALPRTVEFVLGGPFSANAR